MDTRIKYYLEFDQLKGLPDYNRLRAEQRFLLIKAYEKLIERESEQLGRAFRKKPATLKFCDDYSIPSRTFYRWLSTYRKCGILGLVSRFGNRAEKDNFPHRTSPAEPIMATIRIDPKNPLFCLDQIKGIVTQHPDITPKTKESLTRIIEEEIRPLKKDTFPTLYRSLTPEEIEILGNYQEGTHKNHNKRATGLLMLNEKSSVQEIMVATGRSRRTVYRWVRWFESRGLNFIETKATGGKRAERMKERRTRVLDIFHAPPSSYGIHRSSWTRPVVAEAYRQTYFEHLPLGAISRIFKEAGYSRRKSREVLTSKDPEYRPKVEKIKNILSKLVEGDAFFFIDEAGPWRVKKYGGWTWVRQGEGIIVPVLQSPKGKIYWIAALEAKTNQVVWRYIDGKNARAVVSILEMILDRYRAHSRLFVTWDALSSHNSKTVNNWIGTHNFNARWESLPKVVVCPLPKCSQFLNVVETTFGNTRRAVINNSDYQSVDEMKAAIDGFIKDRNAYFRQNPKRAGNKIWDKEIFNQERWIEGLYRRM